MGGFGQQIERDFQYAPPRARAYSVAKCRPQMIAHVLRAVGGAGESATPAATAR